MSIRVRILLILLLGSINARGYYYKQYTTSKKLISNMVYHSLRDSKGYMWFFTDKGVSKFDGETFKNFTQDEGLADHEIFSGYEDKEGRIWMFTYNGNFCYIKDDKIYNVYNDNFLKTLPVTSFITSMTETQDSTIYIGYINGKVIKIQKDKFSWVCPDADETYDMQCFYKTGDVIMQLKTGATTFIIKHKVYKKVNVPRAFKFANDGYIIFVNDSGLELKCGNNILWKKNEKYLRYGNVITAYYDQNDRIFCGTSDGLYIVNIKTGKEDVVIKNFKISFINQDVYKNYWVTTLGNGIFYLNKNLEKISYLEKVTNFRSIVTNNDQTFFLNGTKVYYYHDNNFKALPAPRNNNIEPLYVDNNLFLYCIGMDMFCYNYTKNATERITKPYNYVGIKYIYPTNGDEYVIVWTNFVQLATISNGHINNLNDHKPIFRIGKSCFDNQHTVYLSSNNHVCKFDVQTGQLSLIDSFNEYESSISKMFLINGKLVVAANSNRLIIYDIEKTPIVKQEVKYPVACYDIMRTQNENAYILNTSRKYYLTTDIYNFSGGAHFIESPIAGSNVLSMNTSEHNVICNVAGNYYSFDDNLLNNDNKTPIFFIDKIAVNDRNVNSTNIEVKNSIHTHLSVTLNYLKFDLASPYTYQYRIIHDDTSKWISTTSDNLDIYLEKFGSYAIEIRAASENNYLSPSKTVLLSITPPFFYSYPFYMLLLLSLGAIVAVAIRRYNARRALAFNNELNYLQMEHKAINSLLNPHFIFNAVNNIQSLINVDSREKANDYLATLSKLIRQNIENLQFSFISVSRELNLIRNYVILQNLRFDNRIYLTIEDATGRADEIQIPPLLIHTFVENCVVHGFKKDMQHFAMLITLQLSTDDYLVVKVKDNGAGLKAKNKSALSEKLSLGIDFMRRRLTRLSNFYKVDFSLEIADLADSAGSGTEVTIVIYSKFNNVISPRLP